LKLAIEPPARWIPREGVTNVTAEVTVMKELVEYIAKALVDHPESVQVNVVEGGKTKVLELRVHPDDMGQVIGKHGRTAKSMRTLLNAAATKDNIRVVLEIVE
jgi:hypothetical protein